MQQNAQLSIWPEAFYETRLEVGLFCFYSEAAVI